MTTSDVCRRTILCPILLALACALAASADTIRLKDGRVIQGKVVQFRNGEFVVRVPSTDAHRGHRDRMILLVGIVDSIEFETTTPTTERAPTKQGVTLFADVDYRGTSEVFYESNPDLRDNPIGNDRASSIRVPPGYLVTLYEDTNYRGRSAVLRNDEARLGDTSVGNDQVSSIRIDKEGVTLFGDVDYRGTSEVFYESDPDLRDNPIGNDRASSIRVPPGYLVTLYEDTNYRGRSAVLRNDEARLGNTSVGNDQVSSIRIERAGSQR